MRREGKSPIAPNDEHIYCRNAVKNVKFAKTLSEVIGEAGISADQGCHRSKGNLIYAAASKVCEISEG